MWEVDPETKSKLLALQKLPANTLCADCAAPSPQWATPKLGLFICLTCAGHHRGLGVHISFVRSITMDAFKTHETRRMELGGNAAFRTFWTEKNPGVEWAVPPSMEVLMERYGGDVGDEWRERLGCRVEGREFAGVPKKAEVRKTVGGEGMGVRGASPAGSMGGGVGGRKEANEAYFARMGDSNAGRPEGVAPSQGGKYAGFGSEPAVLPREQEGKMPGVDEFQKDPVGALTKGFGWLSSSVGKGARTVNEGWVRPTAQKLAEADLATQARMTAAQVGQTIQTGTKGAAEQLNRFIDEGGKGGARGGGSSRMAAEPERKDFWDTFGSPDASSAMPEKQSSAIGTAAMRKGGGSKEDGWGDDDKW